MSLEENEFDLEISQGIIGYAGSLGRSGGWFRRNEALIWMRAKPREIKVSVPEFQRTLQYLIDQGLITITKQEKRKQWMMLNWKAYDEVNLNEAEERKVQRQIRQLPQAERSNLRELIRMNRIKKTKLNPLIEAGQVLYNAMTQPERKAWQDCIEHINDGEQQDQDEPDQVDVTVNDESVFLYLAMMFPHIPPILGEPVPISPEGDQIIKNALDRNHPNYKPGFEEMFLRAFQSGELKVPDNSEPDDM